MKILYAVLIGINNYPSNPLSGCINDVLAVNAHFEKLCRSQKERTIWKPLFLLAPSDGETIKLKDEGIEYIRPTRRNIITAFDHFKEAEAHSDDVCLFYYSGHGSYISTRKMPLFEDYDASGEMQSLVCLDEEENALALHHLLDKELGFLIANALDSKNQSENPSEPSVHFLSIMDCCHSGTNTRSEKNEVKARMHSGKGTTIPDVPIGFTKTGNCFYKPFKSGQEKVLPGGLTSARHISMAAAQSSESAYEMPLSSEDENAGFRNVSHGIFTISLLKTLAQSGTKISYKELAERVRLKVRSRIEKQIPFLDIMMLEDENLYFLKSGFAPPKKEFLISFREKPNAEWILNVGAIQGMVPSNLNQKTTLKLTDGTNRIVTVDKVNSSESLLESQCFTKADKENKLLRAIIHEMAFSTENIAFGKDAPEDRRAKILGAWKKNTPNFLKLVGAEEIHNLSINFKNDHFSLVRLDGKTPLIEGQRDPTIFLRDADKIGKFESVIKLKNLDSSISREDFEVNVKVLEGVPFTAKNLNEIQEEKFRSYSPNPELIEAYFKKVEDKEVQPAIKVEVICTKPMKTVYWIGALYCDAQFGITDQYLQVQQIGKYQTDRVKLEFRMERNGKVHKWQSIPLSIAKEWRNFGVEEITDYLIIFISDAEQPFSLDKYNQEKITFNPHRAAGFLDWDLPVEDSWEVIRIPIRIKLGI